MRRFFGMLLAVALLTVGSANAQDVVKHRVEKFKQNGADIQAIFKKHVPRGDFKAVEAAAARMAAWGAEMTDYFPPGATSDGARASLWDNFGDFTAKAVAFEAAARELQQAAAVDSAVKSMLEQELVKAAAQKVGGTCKACHDSYRIKK